MKSEGKRKNNDVILNYFFFPFSFFLLNISAFSQMKIDFLTLTDGNKAMMMMIQMEAEVSTIICSIKLCLVFAITYYCFYACAFFCYFCVCVGGFNKSKIKGEKGIMGTIS